MKMDIKQTRKMLKSRMNDDLLIHSLGVEKTAFDLAALYGIDQEKAALAGLLHDYGKMLPKSELYRLAHEHDLADDFALQEPALLHAPVGAWLLQHELEIADREILEAVRVHTTGFPGMLPLAKVVYLADCIEPGRDYPGVNDLRDIARRDLDRALLVAVNRTIKYIIKRGRIIHPSSIFFRNFLISSFKKNNQELES